MPWIRDRFRNRIDYREKECVLVLVLVYLQYTLHIDTLRKALLLNMGLFDSDYGTFEISVCARDPMVAAAFIGNGTDVEYINTRQKKTAEKKRV